MREILFRGKRKDNGEWVEGFYFQKPNPFSEDGLPVTHAISDIPPFGYDVYFETVGQYTGLTDKNGNKIFEGDILNTTNSNCAIWYVDYKNTAFCCNQGDEFMQFSDVEVIGNIYDNPELLEVGK